MTLRWTVFTEFPLSWPFFDHRLCGCFAIFAFLLGGGEKFYRTRLWIIDFRQFFTWILDPPCLFATLTMLMVPLLDRSAFRSMKSGPLLDALRWDKIAPCSWGFFQYWRWIHNSITKPFTVWQQLYNFVFGSLGSCIESQFVTLH